MRPLGPASVFLVGAALVVPLAAAAVYAEVIPSAGWDVWVIEGFGNRMSADSLATTDGPALTGLSILSESGDLLGRAFGFVAGGGVGAQTAIAEAGAMQSVDQNGQSDFFGGAGVSIETALPRVYVVAWAAGDGIHRKIQISTTAGSTPTLTLLARGTEAFYYTSDDSSTGAAVEGQVLLAEADLAVGAARAFSTEGRFFGLVGGSALPEGRNVLLTLPNGTVVEGPIEFVKPSHAPGSGEFRIEWQGANVDLSRPVIGGADVRLPPIFG